uniref:Uncharacterized protein n=2 Tax=Picea TaxID=3328 RepID=A0A101M175_PICGL|nr:hypothetical protein ABT39_MTgene3705 [Picea glauca]QHR90304.1 hypothetical protein Q903MT_gene4327 [Picea sitchensis]
MLKPLLLDLLLELRLALLLLTLVLCLCLLPFPPSPLLKPPTLFVEPCLTCHTTFLSLPTFVPFYWTLCLTPLRIA